MPSTIGIVASHIVPEKTTVVMGANSANGWIAAFPITSYGWGTRLANPVSLPTNSIGDLSFSPSASALLINWASTPQQRLRAYQWTSSGFGSAYTSVSGTFGFRPIFNNASTRIIYTIQASGSNQTIARRVWSDSTGFGTETTGTTIPGSTQQIAMHPSGNSVAFAHENSPTISVFPWSDSTGFGTKYANPSPALPPDVSYGVTFNPSGNAITMGIFGDAGIASYAWSNSTGFGTKYSDPSPSLPGNTFKTAYSPNGNDIVLAHSGSPYVTAYSWSSGFGTKYSNPTSLPAGNGNKISFTPSGTEVVVGVNGSPDLVAYAWNSGWGTKYANPSVTPTSAEFTISPKYN